MVHEHNHHSDQKEFFMKSYNEMLNRIEPQKIICYSEPFEEMQGDIIYVDYELSNWKYLNSKDNRLPKRLENGIIVHKTYTQLSELFFKGTGSAYGGKWKPKNEDSERLLGKPGEIKESYNSKGEKRWTKIGSDGRATKERHFSNHNRGDKHTNPHDHEIGWDENSGKPSFGSPINFFDSIPEFKSYKGVNVIMAKRNYNFESISDFKWCVDFGGEVEFTWKGNVYSITHPDGKINIGAGCYQKDGKYFNMNTNQEYSSQDEMWANTADEILEFNVAGDRLRDVITNVDVVHRTF